MTNTTSTRSNSQYSLVKILGIWVAVVAPMVILAYVVKPAIAPDFETDPIRIVPNHCLPRKRRPELGVHPAALVAQHASRP